MSPSTLAVKNLLSTDGIMSAISLYKHTVICSLMSSGIVCLDFEDYTEKRAEKYSLLCERETDK